MVSRAKLEEISARTKAFLQGELDELFQQKINPLLRTAKLSTIKEKLIGRQSAMLIIDGMIEKLPESLELFVHKTEPFDAQKQPQLRANFNKAAKRRFLKSALAENEDNFRQMGLDDAQIESLKNGQMPLTPGGYRLDVSIDHIIELSNGGRNNHDNLCILPEYINLYKSTFIQTQVRAGLEEILVIRPKPIDNKPVLVPIIAGGFRRATSHGPRIRERMENLLQMKLENV